MEVGDAKPRVGVWLAVDQGPGGDDPKLAPQGGQRVGARGGVVGGGGDPGVRARQDVERLALALEDVVVGVDGRRAAPGLAELDRVGVDDVLAGGGGAPGVVAAPSELHVEVGSGEGNAPGIDRWPLARRRCVDVLLHQDLRRPVAGLRPHHGDGMAALGLARRDEQRVRGAVVLEQGLEHPGRELAPGPGGGGVRALARGLGDFRELQGARVGQGDPLRLGRRLAVGEAPAPYGRRRLGVVELLEVGPDPLARRRRRTAAAPLRGTARRRALRPRPCRRSRRPARRSRSRP